MNQIARLMVKDQDRLVRLGSATGAKLVASGLSKSVRNFRDGLPVIYPVLDAFDELVELITDVMIASHLEGIRRARRYLPIKLSFKRSVDFLKKRLALTEGEIIRLRSQYSQEALRVVPKLKAATDRQLQHTMVKITEKGLHVREGVKALRKGFAAAGITPKSKFMLETVFRTQTQLAYSAGRWDQEQLSEVQEILWGYTYSTVGDDRVREEHVGFDGVTLPKDDAFWEVNFPPNGWNCRCVAIPVYEERKSVEPKAIDGVYPKATEGFNFHPGKLYGLIK